jgi:gas vesicle protein
MSVPHRIVRPRESIEQEKGKRRQNMSMRDNGIFVGALTLSGGAMIGAGIALLFAPRSGKNTRKEIALTTRKAGRRMKRAAREISDGVSGVVDSVENVTADFLAKGREVAYGVRRKLRDTLEAGEAMLIRQKGKPGNLPS